MRGAYGGSYYFQMKISLLIALVILLSLNSWAAQNVGMGKEAMPAISLIVGMRIPIPAMPSSLPLGSASLGTISSVQPAPEVIKAYFEAAKAGDIVGLDRALASGIPVDYQDGMTAFGQTALLTAAAHRRPALVAHLLEKGASAGAKDSLGTTAVIYGTLNRDLETLDLLLASPQADLMALDMNLRSAFDHAREAGDTRVLDRLNKKLAVLDLSGQPEHYLVVNFQGLGGGGRIESRELDNQPRIAGIQYAQRNRTEFQQAQKLIERWMSFDRSQGGPRWQSLVLVGASWGAGPSQRLARWFLKRYGFPVRLHVIIEGANLLGLPFRKIGPAEIRKGYHVEGFHWPRGGSLREADNVSLGDMDHNSGLYLGAQRAIKDILDLLARGLRRGLP